MKVYLVGSHSSGKSTLARYISQKYNIPMIVEVARQVLSEQELQSRKNLNPIDMPSAKRGYLKLFLETVTQAEHGVDFDFLRSPESNGKTPRT